MNEQQPLGKLAVSPVQAAEILGLSRTKLYAMLKRGELHPVREGKRLLVPVWALEKYVGKPE